MGRTMIFAARVCAFATATVITAAAAAPAPPTHDAAAVAWHDLAQLVPIEGKGWPETRTPYDRLPARAEGLVRAPVWNLAQDSAGLSIRFVTDAGEIRARWTLRKPNRFALPHMPATGVSGLDLYVRDAGRWRWLAVGRPEKPDTNDQPLVRGLTRARREYLLHLPLYNGVSSVEIGLPPEAVLSPAPDRYAGRRPIVFYGTSITQGGCASRPGMAYPAIIGRQLDWPIINLGFSGNGKTEPEIAALLAELDPAAYVLDSLPNLDVAQVGERVEPFVRTLRAAHPATPIILVENVNYANTGFLASRREKVTAANALVRQLYDKMKAAGDPQVHCVPAFLLLGGDGEDTVDGTHPTDLGFDRIARGMVPVLRAALRSAGVVVPDEEGFVPLCDGKTLGDWVSHDAFSAARKETPGSRWWIEDGALVGAPGADGRGGFLWLNRPFADFILKTEVKLDYPIDSGVFLRVGPTGRSHQVMLDYLPTPHIGAIFIPFQKFVYRNPEGFRALRKDEWNDLEIRLEGEPARIRVWLNGRLITDFQHTAETTTDVPTAGGIALQAHPYVGDAAVRGADRTVRYRNMRIKELSSSHSR